MTIPQKNKETDNDRNESKLKLDKEVTPICKGERDPRVLLNSAVTMFK